MVSGGVTCAVLASMRLLEALPSSHDAAFLPPRPPTCNAPRAAAAAAAWAMQHDRSMRLLEAGCGATRPHFCRRALPPATDRWWRQQRRRSVTHEHSVTLLEASST
jgi:hypothetical protein